MKTRIKCIAEREHGQDCTIIVTPQSAKQNQYNTRAVRWKTNYISPIFNTDFVIVLHIFLEILILYFLSTPRDKSTLF